MYSNIECNVSQQCQRQIVFWPTLSSHRRDYSVISVVFRAVLLQCFLSHRRDERSSKLCFHHGDSLQNGTPIRFFRSRVSILISRSDALVHLPSPTERDPRRSLGQRESHLSLNGAAVLRLVSLLGPVVLPVVGPGFYEPIPNVYTFFYVMSRTYLLVASSTAWR
ncbi:hypothetical protein T01_2913 [Trichinella spiralis]|uniref:Uncharacterized protein n=1 Tax=Trichinella spiralis TaxID=6334 RepID=A0A0V1BF91_TRISP|nr:hypothetical protein T01_2913 [Trichinella spiralis]